MLADLPTGFDFWQTVDLHMLDRCDEVMVVCMDGWQDSQGVKAEIAHAKQIGKRVMYVDPTPCHTT